MSSSSVAAVLSVAAAVTALSAQAEDRRKDARDSHRIASGMRVIANGSAVGQPGHGWRYFADARRGRAVVISPSGDYYYNSHGRGFNLVHRGSPDSRVG
jgi:hypothetical protein